MTEQNFVIIGAGPAGMRAAEVLRQQAPEAEITLIGDEPHFPYNRPPLSKDYITGALDLAGLHLKPETFYAEQKVNLRLGSAATRIDRAAKYVELADGARIPYGKLLLTTGCRFRRLPPSLETVPVHYLRSLADAKAIKEALPASPDIVLIGGGFIGLELAASATKQGARVTVIEAAPRLMVRTMPSVIGDAVRTLHERNGVRFEFDARLKTIEPRGGGILVRTERADYPCAMIVAGVGAAPNTELAEAAGLIVEDGVRVDAKGHTSDPDIFAAGDVTRHENPMLGRHIRVESWQVALNQAAVVARAMVGDGEAYVEMPWLWSDQYDWNIQVLGLVDPAMELVVRGDPSSPNFTVLGLDGDGRIVAAITVNNGRDMAVLRRLVAANANLPKDALADPAVKLADLLKAAKRGP